MYKKRKVAMLTMNFPPGLFVITQKWASRDLGFMQEHYLLKRIHLHGRHHSMCPTERGQGVLTGAWETGNKKNATSEFTCIFILEAAGKSIWKPRGRRLSFNHGQCLFKISKAQLFINASLLLAHFFSTVSGLLNEKTSYKTCFPPPVFLVM